jgi:hypothetical protein
MAKLEDLPDDVLDRIFDLADRQDGRSTFRLRMMCRHFRWLLRDLWHWAFFRLSLFALFDLLKGRKATSYQNFSVLCWEWTKDARISWTYRMKFF